jgi:hypothetical protein
MASQLRGRHWIGGEWTDAPGVAESIDPASGETIGTFTEATDTMATRAITVALKSFQDSDWRETGSPRRSGPRTLTVRCASPGSCKRALSGSITGRSSTTRRKKVATSRAVSAG